MICKSELKKIFPEPFVTKGMVKERMNYKTYNEIRPYFYGLDHLGSKYLRDDVIERMVQEVKRNDCED